MWTGAHVICCLCFYFDEHSQHLCAIFSVVKLKFLCFLNLILNDSIHVGFPVLTAGALNNDAQKTAKSQQKLNVLSGGKVCCDVFFRLVKVECLKGIYVLFMEM